MTWQTVVMTTWHALQDGGPGQNGNLSSPMEMVWRAEPIKVHGSVVASYGSKSMSYCTSLLDALHEWHPG